MIVFGIKKFPVLLEESCIKLFIFDISTLCLSITKSKLWGKYFREQIQMKTLIKIKN